MSIIYINVYLERGDRMNTKLALFVITLSGIAAILRGGIESGIMYAINIALVSLFCIYSSTKKKNNELFQIR